MTEDAATYEPGEKLCKCGCGRPVKPRSRYHEAACRARYSRQRGNHQTGQVKRCQVTKDGKVSITVHLTDSWQHRTHELVPGTWVDVVPHRSET